MSAVIEIKGFDKIIKLANKYPAIAEKEVNNAIRLSFELLSGTIRTKAPRGVTGDLRNSWKKEYGRFYGRMSSGVDYASDVEFGTTPHYVSAQTLAPWAEKKGLNPWAVSKNIQKFGTKANPFFKESIKYTQNGFDKVFGQALVNITKQVVQ